MLLACDSNPNPCQMNNLKYTTDARKQLKDVQFPIETFHQHLMGAWPTTIKSQFTHVSHVVPLSPPSLLSKQSSSIIVDHKVSLLVQMKNVSAELSFMIIWSTCRDSERLSRSSGRKSMYVLEQMNHYLQFNQLHVFPKLTKQPYDHYVT